MNKICLIGNGGIKHNNRDGQTTKVRLYLKRIKDEGFEIDFIDLEDFFKHPFYILRRIKNGIKYCDRIVFISAERGTKILLPFINRKNKKYKKPLVLPLIGIGLLHFSIDKLCVEEKNDFLINKNYSYCKVPKKYVSQLSKANLILPETELLAETYKKFYGLTNVQVLTNFRDETSMNKERSSISDPIKLVFLSRVTDIKGIFDLIDVVKKLNKDSKRFVLDIYGQKHFANDDGAYFGSLIDGSTIRYCGSIDNQKVIETLNKYDLFVFPTKYYGEGTPGVIVESFIAGTPILTSNFPQAKYLMKDEYDSIFYEMFNKEDFKKKLLSVIDNKNILIELSKNALKSGEKYTYQHNRKVFLKYVCGRE